MFDISLLFIFQSTSSLSEMKKSSGLKNVGGDTGKLIVYSDPDFQGEEHTFLGTENFCNFHKSIYSLRGLLHILMSKINTELH